MTPKKAEQILDKLGIEYEKVTLGHTLIVKLKDGNRVTFKKLIRNHEKSMSPEVSDIIFSPSPVIVEEIVIENPERHIETQKIIKKKKSK